MTDRLDTVISRVDADLTAFLDDRAAALDRLGADIEPVLAAARSLVLDGGKRLRPIFVYWGWRAVHGPDEDDRALISAAASLELLHACALVHDDVMDASETRRGRPSAHAAFATLHRDSGWTGDAEVFGTAAAIVLGDLLLSWADAMFARAGVPDRRGAQRVRRDASARHGRSVPGHARPRRAARTTSTRRCGSSSSRRASTPIEGPLHLGAAVAGAPREVFDVLTAYGLALGEAFQLRDDVLGVFGDPSVTGKPAGDDLREGKHTAAHRAGHAGRRRRPGRRAARRAR